jgi:hypothetical protein
MLRGTESIHWTNFPLPYEAKMKQVSRSSLKATLQFKAEAALNATWVDEIKVSFNLPCRTRNTSRGFMTG